MKNIFSTLTLFSLLLILAACANTNTVQRNPYDSNETSRNNSEVGSVSSVDVKQSHLDLAAYLRKVPGISVQGSGDNVNVYVRGINSVGQELEPLYIINSTPVGNSYQQVSNAVDINDISNVTVLKDVASTNQYGMRGSNGVIVIRTKKR
jgi:TonB-dependent SusC/RagA subfamily outer membrane receptor